MRGMKLVVLAGAVWLGLSLLLTQPEPAGAADPVVSNVQAAQLAGTKLVDITYDVEDVDGDNLTISVQVSDDGGATYNVPASHFTGDYGAGITPGTNKKIVWDAGADWDQNYSQTMRFRVTANDGQASAPDGMVLIPAGSFQMGDNYNEGYADQLPVHTVMVSAFYLDKYEVTKALWDEVSTWATANGYSFSGYAGGTAAVYPVMQVQWMEAVKWLNARSEKEGRTPLYYTDPLRTTPYRTGEINVTYTAVKWGENGYRLPTEAEWEKACRGGIEGNHYPWPSDGGSYTDWINWSMANYGSNNLGTLPVGYYNGQQVPKGGDMANGYGLYDMAGNVREWTWDAYNGSYYAESPATDPWGPPTVDKRVIRGGSYGSSTTTLRCAARGWGWPSAIGSPVGDVGFRSVLSKP